MSFVHLHVHSEYSWLDGACTIEALIQRAVQLKMPAVAITDRNSVAGASRLWHQCIKAGVKPIIGLEIEVLNDISDGRAFSVILLAKNGDGYENLCQLITLAYEHSPLTPKITKSQLQAYAQDLICLSFSVVGELCTLLLEGRDQDARMVSDWYYSVFGEDYYYEIQDHGLPREAVAMNKLLNLAYETQIPVVLTNDCHYMERKDSVAIDALNCIRKGIDFSHPDAKRFACNEYYFKTPREMKELGNFPSHLITNTMAIADKICSFAYYIPVWEDELHVTSIVNILRVFSSTLRVRFKLGSKHIEASLMDNDPAAVLEYLQSELPDYGILPWTEYQNWTLVSIYSAVQRSLIVPEEKISMLAEYIPSEAKTLLEAVLINAHFSCFTSEDNVCGLAADIGDTLINTFKDQRSIWHGWAIIPKDNLVPIVRDNEGNQRCQYDFTDIVRNGFISLEFHA